MISCGLAVLAWPGQALLGAEINADLPSALPAARYEQMIRKSPFALATPVVAAPATPGFAASLYVTGIAKIGNADFVSISSRDQQSKFSLLSGEQGKDDISLVSVEWSDQIGKSKVTIKKGAEFAVLEFDQAALAAQPAQPVAPPLPMGGGPPGMPQPGGPRRIILPNQPNQPGTQQPGTGSAPVPRQRLRLINNKPQ